MRDYQFTAVSYYWNALSNQFGSQQVPVKISQTAISRLIVTAICYQRKALPHPPGAQRVPAKTCRTASSAKWRSQR
jgi:hypothetical protein